MTETKMHRFLKKVGMAFLHNQKCFIMATEVYIPRYLLCLSREERMKRHPLDKHSIVDVCGVGEKYIPYSKRPIKYKNYKFKIVRGIEVKVSRSDFKNGFVCSGCNYHYLLTPRGLVSKSELPKGVGLLEVSKDNFRCRLGSDGRFYIECLTVLRPPSFKATNEKIIDNIILNLGVCATRFIVRNIAEEFEGEHE